MLLSVQVKFVSGWRALEICKNEKLLIVTLQLEASCHFWYDTHIIPVFHGTTQTCVTQLILLLGFTTNVGNLMTRLEVEVDSQCCFG